MLLGDGDGFVRCACGYWHWGVHGAAGLLVFDAERGVLLQRRAWWTHHGRTWALPGGAVRSDETPAQAAVREAGEEADVPAGGLRPLAESTEEHDTWRYTTVLARNGTAFEARAVSPESAGMRWVPAHEVPMLPLHRDFAAAWPALAEQLDREFRLIVDARVPCGPGQSGGRAGELAELRTRLDELSATAVPAGELGLPGAARWGWWPRVSLVVDETVPPLGDGARVEVLSARDPGAELLAVARKARARSTRDHVLVTTADREVRARLDELGVELLDSATLARLTAAPRANLPGHHS